MAETCGSENLTSMLVDQLQSTDHILIGDTKHDDKRILDAVSETIPALAENGVKHLFLEVSDSLEYLLDNSNEDFGQNPKARELLEFWASQPEAIIAIVDRARQHGIKVHFADDHENIVEHLKDPLIFRQCIHLRDVAVLLSRISYVEQYD